MSGKTVSLTMTVRELDAVAFACLREHAKLGRNENVNTEILQKICTALHCDVCDIMEMEDETNS